MGSRVSKKKAQIKQPSLWIERLSKAASDMTNQTKEMMVGAWEELDTRRRREILSIFLIASALISLLALLTYSPEDLAAYSYSGNAGQTERPIHNWVGKPGALLAYSIIFMFGAAGYSLPALLLLWGIDRIRSGAYAPLRKVRILGCLILLITLSSFMGLLTELLNPALGDEQAWHVCGAMGFLLKDSEPQELIEAIRNAYKGQPTLHPNIARKMLRELGRASADVPIPDPLTDRETEVLRLLSKGFDNQEIAEKLFVAEVTVRTHVSRILRKLQLANRVQATLYALKNGLSSLDDESKG